MPEVDFLLATALAALVLTVALTALSGLLDWSGPIRLRHWLEEAGGGLRSLLRQPRRIRLLRTGLSLLVRILPVAAVLLLVRSLGLGTMGDLLVALVLVGASVVAGELIGRWLATHRAERALEIATPLLRIVHLLQLPLALLIERLMPTTDTVESRQEQLGAEVSRDEIEAFIRVGSREGILQSGDEDLIWRIVGFGGTQVRSVMQPRTDIVGAARDLRFEEMTEVFLESGHSRLPVYGESIDEIVGVLHLRDLLDAQGAADARELSELLVTPPVVPESKLLPDLLRELQAARQQMAIVVDEYGGTAGLVTVEDLVEELVGEILDEHEPLRPAVEALPEGRWRLDGSCPVESLRELFGVGVSEAPSETVGGLVFASLGQLPLPGDRVESLGLEFRVERTAGRRVRTVVVEEAIPEEVTP